MSHIIQAFVLLILSAKVCSSLKPEVDYFKEYGAFLNFGEKKVAKLNKTALENSILKSKVDVLGDVFKMSIDKIKTSSIMDLVFLIDASSSVGEFNFRSELKFVKKLLSDVTVDYNHTRIGIVTFSSLNNVVMNILKFMIVNL